MNVSGIAKVLVAQSDETVVDGEVVTLNQARMAIVLTCARIVWQMGWAWALSSADRRFPIVGISDDPN